MRTLLLLTPIALSVAIPATAQSTFTASSPDRTAMSRAEAVIRAQALRLASLTQQADFLASELAKRQTCESGGKLYIDGHAAADAQGCVDPNDF